MKALDRLRALENSQASPRGILTKPTEPPFGGFVGAFPGLLEKITAASNEHTPATPEQAAELRALFAIVAADWPDVEQAEALALALSDPEAALTCFRELARESERHTRACARKVGPYTTAPLAERDSTDDRRLCTECANRTPQGRCLSAWRREGPGAAARDYHPIANMLRRCECYVPRADDPDQRTGAERWPAIPNGTRDTEKFRDE